MVTTERTTAQSATGRTTTDAYAARFGQGGERHARLVAGGAPEEIATPLTGEAARAHLRGEFSLGLYLRDGQDRATVGLVAHAGYRTAYDDTGEARRVPEDGIAALQEARQRLALQGIDAAVERAPQGGRLWVFTSEPVPSEDVHALLRMATRGQEVEVYPRPERDEAAQQPVRAPLGVHPDDGRRYGFVDRAGRPVGATLAAQVEHLESVRRVDVGRELGTRPYLRDELAALDPRGPAPALTEPQERQPEQLDRTERMMPVPAATSWARKGGMDRTAEAVRAQLAGMGAERYDVGVYDRANDAMLLRREWTPAQIEASIGWFRGMNANGRDIYIRPTGSSGLYLIDDVPAATVERMRAEGYTPAAVVETSPGNLQAWVRVSDTPLSNEEGTAVARDLATRYGGDMSSANWRHMGRLAGFTNRKEEHTQPNGQHPYAKLHDAGGARAPETPAILDWARAQATQSRRAGAGERDGAEPPRDQAARREAFTRPPARGGPVSFLGREYAHRAQRLLDRYPNAALTDLHRLDWMVTRDLARAHPEARKEDLMRAIGEGSPRIDERKRGHVYDYAERTTRYVLLDPDVERARSEVARSANRERDRWF